MFGAFCGVGRRVAVRSRLYIPMQYFDRRNLPYTAGALVALGVDWYVRAKPRQGA